MTHTHNFWWSCRLECTKDTILTFDPANTISEKFGTDLWSSTHFFVRNSGLFCHPAQLVSYLVFWAKSTTKSYIMAKTQHRDFLRETVLTCDPALIIFEKFGTGLWSSTHFFVRNSGLLCDPPTQFFGDTILSCDPAPTILVEKVGMALWSSTPYSWEIQDLTMWSSIHVCPKFRTQLCDPATAVPEKYIATLWSSNYYSRTTPTLWPHSGRVPFSAAVPQDCSEYNLISLCPYR